MITDRLAPLLSIEVIKPETEGHAYILDSITEVFTDTSCQHATIVKHAMQ